MRAYILAMIRHTCRRVSKGTLAECLRLEGSALDALVRTPETLTRLVTLDCGASLERPRLERACLP